MQLTGDVDWMGTAAFLGFVDGLVLAVLYQLLRNNRRNRVLDKLSPTSAGIMLGTIALLTGSWDVMVGLVAGVINGIVGWMGGLAIHWVIQPSFWHTGNH